jgi:biopolymer transport protein ExbD
MSHGGGGEMSAEPNMTPLLDLVLQLLMFFIICVNFTTAVTNTGEFLPESDTVKPLATDGADIIILSVKPFRMGTRTTVKEDVDGKPKLVEKVVDDFKDFTEKERDSLRNRFRDLDVCIVMPGEQAPERTPRDLLVRRMIDMKFALDQTALRLKRDDANVDSNGKIKTPIHIRADEAVKYGEIYQLTQMCKDAGFINVKPRAILGQKEKN